MEIEELLRHRFVVDSREVRPGDVFVAIRGSRVDGHEFVGEAISKGAFAVVVERDVGVSNQLIVQDTVRFLGETARTLVASQRPVIVGITGSNGKTTTKEVVWAALNAEVGAFKNEGNLNSEIGLPLSVINNYRGERYLVLEMAQRVVGDIKYLCDLFPPTIGVLLNAGSAHVGVVGSLEEIFRGKWQIVEGSESALVNFDDPRMRCRRCRYFGRTGGDYVLVEKKFDGERTLLTFRKGSEDFFYALSGYWTTTMSLSALVAFGVLDMLDIFFNPLALAEFRPLKGRFNVHTVGAGFLIDDSYNASFESFKAGIEEVLENFPKPRYAVVGAMKELGPYSAEYHSRLSTLLEEMDGVVVCDAEEEAQAIAPRNVIYRSPSHDEIAAFLRKTLFKGDRAFSGTLYFKASRAVQLEKVVDKLLSGV